MAARGGKGGGAERGRESVVVVYRCESDERRNRSERWKAMQRPSSFKLAHCDPRTERSRESMHSRGEIEGS